MANGTDWGPGSFDYNSKRIYFTSTSDRGSPITSTDGPSMGMMMMGGQLACVSCHGTNAKGGKHTMHIETMDAPDIRWSTISGDKNEKGAIVSKQHMDYGFEAFKNTVENGKNPDGEILKKDMPRWQMSDADLTDLMNYLKTQE